MIRKILIFLIFILSIQVSVAASLTLDQQRREFISAETMIKRGGNPLSFSRDDKLKYYPLYPYIQYQWLVKNLGETKKIKDFLRYNKDSRYAGLLRYKWQIYLAKHKNWSEYIEQFQKTSNIKLQCHYFRAKYNLGAKVEALTAAKKIWVVGKSLPNECDPIFKVLLGSKYFTKDMLWQRFDAAITKGESAVAKYVKGLMSKKDQKVAQLWLKVRSNPWLIYDKTKLNNTSAQAGLIFAHGIERLAKKSLSKAIMLWDDRKSEFSINEATVQRIEQRLAMSLAYNRDDNAYSRLSKLSKPDEKTKEWRIRTALRAQNWPNVEESIAALSKESKKKEKWRYWLARASEKIDKQKAANFIYSRLATERSFYGYLSAEKLNKDYQLSNNPIQVAPEMFKRFKNKKEFLVVSELIKVDKKLEAERQWWYVIPKLDKKQILLAAKYAEELKWKKVAIFTLAKAKYWDDVAVRFPLAYTSQVQHNAKKQQLNPAIIFGLIRRESAFNKNAFSPVGARGLMQIMPKTCSESACFSYDGQLE